MKFKKIILFLLTGTLIMNLFGCALIGEDNDPLDSTKPVTVTLWHYYNGKIKDNFDSLVEKFNETIGVERGIVVDAKSLGDVGQLADSVFNAANKKIGSQLLPDIFMAYPENAYRVNQITELVDIETLFSEEEIKMYKSDFLAEGRFGNDEKLKILPIAKSTENLFVNKTFWDKFSKNTGADIEKLSTWEGLVETAKLYKEHTGKAFLGIDATANYMLLSAMQLGREIYSYDGSDISFNFQRDIARSIWDYYYIPYVKGYFEKNGRFSSDDAKTGAVLAYTGSTAGTIYFPMEVNVDNVVQSIEPMILPYPHFEKGKPFAIQQGAGMCITKSDEAHEYASAIFLKWFTQGEQNIEFAISTGYFPVMDKSLDKEKLIEQVNISEFAGEAIPKMIESTNYMFENYTLYSNKPFEKSYEMRGLLENHLYNKVGKDLEILAGSIEDGKQETEVIESLISDAEFEKWYNDINDKASLILGK